MTIKDWIKKEKLTYERAAMRLGISKQALNKYTDGKNPTIPRLEVAILIFVLSDGEITFTDMVPEKLRKFISVKSFLNIVEYETNISL